MLPRLSVAIPCGALKRAWLPGPSWNPAVPSPARVETVPSLAIRRTRLLAVSATYTIPLASTATPCGLLNWPGSSAQFNNPQGVAVDASGIVYVADTANNRVRRIASDGTVSTLAGDGTAGFQDGPGSQARFNAPQGIAADNLGNIYVADTGNSSLRAINAAGEVRTVAGDGTIGSNNSPN